jgi:hypothetical protein
MDYQKSSEQGKQVTIETVHGGDRIAAHLFIVPGGFVFADMGWNEPLGSGHPFHIVECELTNFGYIDKEKRRLDIYVEDIETPGRGDRKKCWSQIQEFLKL